MNGRITLILALPLALGLGPAWAQDSDEASEDAQPGLAIANEATMRLMDDAEANRPDAVTADIPLPASLEVDLEAVGNAQERKEAAGDRGVEAIENAKSVAADQAQDALNAAQEAIEQRGRGRGRGPEDRPDPPERPETPRP